MTAHRNVNTQEKDNAELFCDYKTSSAATVMWIRKNQVLSTGPDDNNKHQGKYQSFFETKGKEDRNRSTLVVTNVGNSDLGDYTCIVKNAIGDASATIILGYEPETPILEDTHIHGDTVTTQWKIRSWQSLSEVEVKYQQKGVSSNFDTNT